MHKSIQQEEPAAEQEKRSGPALFCMECRMGGGERGMDEITVGRRNRERKNIDKAAEKFPVKYGIFL